jgi:hypothetical protein
LSAQVLDVEKELSSAYYEFHEFEIYLTYERILISKNEEEIFSDEIPGKKVFQPSPGGKYFLIANYQFLDQKIDYPAAINVFDGNAINVYSYSYSAPYDLPHSLTALNDEGILSLFDPLSFNVKIVNESSETEIELEKDIPFEMEKASFVEMNNDYLFILTSLSALDISENKSNAGLYKVDLHDSNFEKKILDYNTPTLLKIIDDNVFASGVGFENLKPIGKTIQYDFEMNEISSNDKIIEKLIPHEDGFYAKYFNVIYNLNEDLAIPEEKSLSEGERILDMGIWNSKLVVVTNISGKSSLYHFFTDLNVDFKLPLPIFEVSKINDLSISEDHLIIRYNSKSIKLKPNRN